MIDNVSKGDRVIFWEVDGFLQALAETTLEGRLEELESIAEEAFGKYEQFSVWADVYVNQRELGSSGSLEVS